MKIFVFGDSIAQGRSDPEFFGWSNRLAIWCQQEALHTNWETAHLVCNMGNAGDETPHVLERFTPEFTFRRGNDRSVVILQVGINDAAHRDDVDNTLSSLEDFTENYRQLLTKATAAAGHVVVLGLSRVDESKVNPYIDSSSGKSWMNENIDQFDTVIELLATEHGGLYVPISDLITGSMCADGLHPDAEGHQLIFERVKATLEKEGIL